MCNRLDVEQKVRLCSLEVLKNITRKELFGGKSPYTIASVALYLASLVLNPKITQDEIVEKANLTVATLKSSYKEILHLRRELLPKDLADKPLPD